MMHCLKWELNKPSRLVPYLILGSLLHLETTATVRVGMFLERPHNLDPAHFRMNLDPSPPVPHLPRMNGSHTIKRVCTNCAHAKYSIFKITQFNLTTNDATPQLRITSLTLHTDGP